MLQNSRSLNFNHAHDLKGYKTVILLTYPAGFVWIDVKIAGIQVE